MTSAATTRPAAHLDEEIRHQEIVNSLRGFLKHQTERVSLYKEFNDAFKEYTAKRMTPEEYATICNIVTEGFVELSIEILALEAHLGGPSHVVTSSPSSSPGVAGTVENATTTTNSSLETRQSISLNSPEHAQLIRQVQVLEKQKLALTVQGQKWLLEKEAQEVQDQQEREAEIQADRIVNGRDDDDEDNDMNGAQGVESEVQVTAEAAVQHVNGGIKLSTEEWQAKLDDNRDRLDEIVEAINDKLADIQEAIAVLVL